MTFGEVLKDDSQSDMYYRKEDVDRFLYSRDVLPNEREGQNRTGVFTNCGYFHTASGWIVRDGQWWVATFRAEKEADDYVAFRNAQTTEPNRNGDGNG
jgi:hypothetical protein